MFGRIIGPPAHVGLEHETDIWRSFLDDRYGAPCVGPTLGDIRQNVAVGQPIQRPKPHGEPSKRPALPRSARAQLLPGITNVREDARPTSGDQIGAALAHCRRWGPLFLLIFVANTFIATLAWTVVGLFLN